MFHVSMRCVRNMTAHMLFQKHLKNLSVTYANMYIIFVNISIIPGAVWVSTSFCQRPPHRKQS